MVCKSTVALLPPLKDHENLPKSELMHGKLFITVVAYVSCVQFTAAYNFLRNFLYDLRTKMFHAAVTEQN